MTAEMSPGRMALRNAKGNDESIEPVIPMSTDSESQDRERIVKRRSFWRSLPLFVRGDVNGFVSLFSNNLATMLVAATSVAGILGKEAVYDYVVPAIAMSMCFGCVYYAIQALLKASATGRTDLCAQPFGINTPGVFAFNACIILPVYYGALEKQGDAAAKKLAWEVGVLANFIQGSVEILLSFAGPYVATAVPMVALLGSLASVGIAFLFTNSFQGEASVPLVGFLPSFLLLMAFLANVAVPRIPSTLVPVLAGTAMAWVTGFATAQAVSDSYQQLGFHPCRLIFTPFENFNQVAQYIAVIIPVALTVSVGTIQCRQLAANVGDEYNLRASMFGDGMATVVAALFGSPYGMTVFIGHSAFKEMGAQVGYLLLCAAAMVAVCFSGVAALILAIVPVEALNPILLFIGLAVCNDALHITDQRHWPAFMVSIVPGFCNWAVEQASSFARAVCSGGTCSVNVNAPNAWTLDQSLRGLYALSQGYLLTSIFLATMLVYVIDRRFARATCWALIAALAASCGLVHSDRLFWPWSAPPPLDAKDGKFIQDRWDLHWAFVGGYGLVAGAFAFCAVLQHWGWIPIGPLGEVNPVVDQHLSGGVFQRPLSSEAEDAERGSHVNALDAAGRPRR